MNYRADEIRAAIGRVQLKKLNAGNFQRKKITEHYIEILNDHDILIPFSTPDAETKSAHHIFPIVLPISVNRNEMMDKMRVVLTTDMMMVTADSERALLAMQTKVRVTSPSTLTWTWTRKLVLMSTTVI